MWWAPLYSCGNRNGQKVPIEWTVNSRKIQIDNTPNNTPNNTPKCEGRYWKIQPDTIEIFKTRSLNVACLHIMFSLPPSSAMMVNTYRKKLLYILFDMIGHDDIYNDMTAWWKPAEQISASFYFHSFLRSFAHPTWDTIAMIMIVIGMTMILYLPITMIMMIIIMMMVEVRWGWSVVMRLTWGGFPVIYTRGDHRSCLFEIPTTLKILRSFQIFI